jgi:sterol desaturase/sphingolipid hydroxylase (fatty acid hydroxylase superfamily)
VHHSAQVLTPITVYRMHPVDDFLTFLLGGVFTGIAGGAIQYLFHHDATVMQIGGLNAVFFLFYLCFYNLRHSHLWLHYPGGLGKIFISPAMHQIHHSSEARHWDTNFGLIFGLWDWAFGTLYLPKEKESFVLGIGAETAEYNTVATLYLLPFKKNWKRFRSLYEKMVLSRSSARQ